MDVIQQVLEVPHLDILYKALKVGYIIANRVLPNMRMNRSLRKPELNSKLFVIAMGSNINSAR